jgi:hypothetical protein
LHHHVHQQGREEAFTFWGACGAIRRDVFLGVGGFDERRYRRPCIEDIELGYRIKATGHRIFLCKDLQVKHWKQWGVVSLFCTDFFHRALPWTELILRSRRLDNDLNISRAARVKVILAYLLAGALALSSLRPWALLPAAALATLLFVLDVHLWYFFWRKRGPLFALRTVPWHWFHYGYGGLAFVIGVARHACHLSRLRER